MITRILTFCLAVAFSTGAVLGHEFWIDPLEFRVETGEPIQAEIRVGQVYQGSGYSYLPRNFRRFEIVESNETVRTVTLTDLEPNVSVSDEIFDFTPPPGTDVFDG